MPARFLADFGCGSVAPGEVGECVEACDEDEEEAVAGDEGGVFECAADDGAEQVGCEGGGGGGGVAEALAEDQVGEEDGGEGDGGGGEEAR